MKMRLWCCLFLFAFCTKAYSQMQHDICEEAVPLNWKVQKGKLALSEDHFKLGKQSVKWSWNAGKNNELLIVDDAFKTVSHDPRSTFVFWVFNEQPVKDKLKFIFPANGASASSFEFSLDFSGWRTAWVMYHRDMTGKPVDGMNTLKIIPPPSVKKGTLYFDQVMYNVNINPRSPMRDFQVPFVNLDGDKAANAHWNSLYQFANNKGYLPLETSITAVHKKEFEQITQRYKELIFPKRLAKQAPDLIDIKKELAFWNIKKTKTNITGRTIFSINDIELVDASLLKAAKQNNETTNIKRYTQLMWDIAIAYQTAKNEVDKLFLEYRFIDLLDHMDNQGWAFGSGMGALHHLGYNMGDFYHASLLMKEVIKKHHKLERTFKSMYWFSGLGRTLEQPAKLPVSNIDVFNTLLGSMLGSILILDNGPDKHRYLTHFSQWMTHNIKPNLEITGAFKPDGAVFHHGTLYPAYGVGGYNGLAPIIYTLSKTAYQVNRDAHASFKQNMLMMHRYTNPTKWPVSVSGRHPTGNWRIPDLPYAYLALAGSPDGKEAIDKEMAAVYLLVTKQKNSSFARQFKENGIQAASSPQGHWNLNFGLLAIHRRADWLLTVKGHNRYFVANESYPNANVYGRYINYGHLEVAFPEDNGQIFSHFEDKGWDWNRFPGTTTLHVPLTKLKADIKNVDDYSGVEEMLLSDQLFAGGISLNQNGMFAMKLCGHDKYQMGSFKAIKSWFMFDDVVIALGSNICNDIKDHTTETTLFQNYLSNKNADLWINKQSNNIFPFQFNKELKTALSVVDNRNIGYFIPKGQQVVLNKASQTSRDQKDLKDTKGDFATLIFDHGKAPKNQTYHYAMKIATDAEQMSDFAKQMVGKQALYKVLQQDSLMHAVKYMSLNTTGLAIFTSNQRIADKYILHNSKPCLLMYKEEEHLLNLSVTDPDLGFYEGEDETTLNLDGTRKEVSIYSRYWFKTPARPSEVNLEIKGNWEKASPAATYQLVKLTNGNTLIKVNCANGMATAVALKKKL
jgi:chondroitin-sulfate-ABC endolyase/exolyase